MAIVPISDIVSQAQNAIDGGNYSSAIDTCQRILGEFPEFATAFRLMGEAYLEQGDQEAARDAFHQTLQRDPQSIPAQVGLGLIAEEAGEGESALAHFQAAWETDPRRRDLREHVTRLSREVYGADGRLYLTRAALASLHFHAGRWSRAITEASQVLQLFEHRLDVQIRLAEALWRYGDDEHAENLVSAILESLPSAVVPLLILADIRRRQDRTSEAEQLLDRARAIDPDGVRAADLILIGWDDQADFFSIHSPPVVDEDALREYQVAGKYAPAPDFMAETEALHSMIDEADNEFIAEETVIPPAVTADSDRDQEIDVHPFRWEDITDEDLDSPSAVFPGDSDDNADESVSFELFSDEELERARPPDEVPRGFTGILESLESEGVAPFDPERADDQILDDMLSSGDDITPEAARQAESETAGDDFDDLFAFAAGEPAAPSEEPAPASTPEPTVQPGPADTILNDLFAETQTGASWPPVSDATAHDDDPLSVDWASVDEEIQRAIPGETPRGYTDELSELDQRGFEPFRFDDRSLFGDLDDDLAAESSAASPSPEPVADEDSFDFSEFDFLDEGMSDPDRDETSRLSSGDVELDTGSPNDQPAGEDEFETVFSGFSFDDLDFGDDETTSQGAGEPSGFSDLIDDLGLDEDVGPEPAASIGPLADDFGDLDDLDDLIGETAPDEFSWSDGVIAEPPADDQRQSDNGVVAESDMPRSEQEAREAPEVWLADDDVEVAPAAHAASGPGTPGGELVTPWREDSASEQPAEPPRPEINVRESLAALGLDRSLVDRFRDAKARLVENGVVVGTDRLPGLAPSIEELEAELTREPGNPDRHLALADALLESDPCRALDEYRWVFRHAGAHFDSALAGVKKIIESGSDVEVEAHRLAGAMYRRRGEWHASANHYGESLGRSRGARKPNRDG